MFVMCFVSKANKIRREFSALKENQRGDFYEKTTYITVYPNDISVFDRL